ncbi:hypothetical protein WA158_004379 [Blastocystis sp. Blastoise]
MQSNLGDSVTLYDILSRNQKKQSWDPWLPNSYICQDEQPVQPLAHDPNAQGSMYSSMAVQALRNHGQSPEDMFIATMNSAKANGDTARYSSMLSQWQTNYGVPTTSKIWYDASNPNNYQYETLLSSIKGLNGLNSEAYKQNKENYEFYSNAQKDMYDQLNNISYQIKTNNDDIHAEAASMKQNMTSNYENLHKDNEYLNSKMDTYENNRQSDNNITNSKMDTYENNRKKDVNNTNSKMDKYENNCHQDYNNTQSRMDKYEKNRQNDTNKTNAKMDNYESNRKKDAKAFEDKMDEQGMHYDIVESGIPFTIYVNGKNSKVICNNPEFKDQVFILKDEKIYVRSAEKSGYIYKTYGTMPLDEFIIKYNEGLFNENKALPDKEHSGLRNQQNDET